MILNSYALPSTMHFYWRYRYIEFKHSYAQQLRANIRCVGRQVDGHELDLVALNDNPFVEIGVDRWMQEYAFGVFRISIAIALL